VTVLELFNEYFLALVIVTGLIVIFIDSRQFNIENRKMEAKRAKFIGYVYIGLAVILYISNKLR
jgi:membrane protein CcdC involved in cytochrome C biogenesis